MHYETQPRPAAMQTLRRRALPGDMGGEPEAAPRKGAPPPTVISELKMWDDILSGVGLRHFLLLLLYDTAVWFYPPYLACSGARAALAASVPDALRSVCGGFALYSSGAAAFLHAFRRAQLLGVVRRARRLAVRYQPSPDMDLDLDAEEAGVQRAASADLAASARLMRLVRINGFTYIKVGSALATLEQFSDEPAIPACLQAGEGAPLGLRLLLSFLEAVKWSCGATYFFSMWLLILTLLVVMRTQYSLLSARLRVARGRREVRECAEWLAEVLQLERDMKDVFFSGLLHMLAGALLVPLINTYQLMFGPRTMFSGLTLSTLPLVYGSMSLLGDRLSLGCDQVCFAAYSGHWVEEEPEVRRLRTLIMQSCDRHAPFAVRGLGGFTRAAAYGVLRTWYQYLNLLISTVT